MAEWTDGQIVTKYLSDIKSEFERENAEWRALEQFEFDKLVEQHGADFMEKNSWAKPTNSVLYELFERVTFSAKHNVVYATLPSGFAITAEVLQMFASSSVTWTHPSIKIDDSNGSPALVVETILVDSWDDERETQWQTENRPHKYWSQYL